jgi:hypothetical protein
VDGAEADDTLTVAVKVCVLLGARVTAIGVSVKVGWVTLIAPQAKLFGWAVA